MIGTGSICFHQLSTSSGKTPQNQGGQPGQFINDLVKKLKPDLSADKKIDDLIKHTGRAIFKTSGLFPFDFFPDELTIDESKINIVEKGLLGDNTHSIQIKDLGDVWVETTPILASLTILDNRYQDQPVVIKNLDPDEAKRARDIIQGLIITRDKEIDITKIKDTNLTQKIEELGKARGVSFT